MGYPLMLDFIEDSTAKAIDNEREKQIAKFGNQEDRSDVESFLICAEEFGEISKVMCQGTVPPLELNHDKYGKELKQEILQTITTLVAWYERFEE